LLYQYGVGLAFLATTRDDGGPRVHPMCPLLTESELYAFIVPSPKRDDLHRDGRYALHSFAAEANEDAFYLTGRADLIADEETTKRLATQFAAERGMTDPPAEIASWQLFASTSSRVCSLGQRDTGTHHRSTRRGMHQRLSQTSAVTVDWPSTGISTSSSIPSSTKNAIAALRSSTTMPTLSIRWIVISPSIGGGPRSTPPAGYGMNRGLLAGCRGRLDGLQNELGRGLGLGHERDVRSPHLHDRRVGALGHEALELRRDRLVLGTEQIPARQCVPRWRSRRTRRRTCDEDGLVELA